MSRTFIEILDEIQEIHEELQNKVFDVIRGDKVEVVRCSECGFESSDGGNFCSNCGARMKGGAE